MILEKILFMALFLCILITLDHQQRNINELNKSIIRLGMKDRAIEGKDN